MSLVANVGVGGTDAAATVWVAVATTLVMIMTPGVAFFYGGMVRARHSLAMIMQSFLALTLVSLTWMLVGFSLAFGAGNGLLGDLRMVGLTGLADGVPGFAEGAAPPIPPMLFAAFHMMFAAVTAALFTGATADRWRLRSFVVVVPLWTVLVYAPVAHWLFSPLGWAAALGAQDFAGGLVVHVNTGAAGLALALVLGRRRGWPRQPMRPHNLPLVLLGAALLWFGWFGFNGGSAMKADGVAVTALVNTHLAACAGVIGWLVIERLRFARATTLGAASGAICGLVAVTPAAGYVTPVSGALIGLVSGLVCAFAVSLKLWFRLDDSLDVVGVHLFGGIVGSLAVGLLSTRTVNPAVRDGLFAGGGYGLLGAQTVALVAVLGYSFGATYVLARVVDRFIGNRVPAATELRGLDAGLHGEAAYEFDPGTFAGSAIGHPANGAGQHQASQPAPDRSEGPTHVPS